MRTTSIYAYGQYVCVAASFNEALAHFEISSLVGVYDITDSLRALCEERLGPWPQGGMLVHLTPDDIKEMKAQEARDQDLSWSRAEAQGLAEKLNEAVLEKAKLQEELAGVRLDHNNLIIASMACQQALDKAEAELARARELIKLYEDDAAREEKALAEAEAHVGDFVTPAAIKAPTPQVAYETPVDPGTIYDESGFALGGTVEEVDPAFYTRRAANMSEEEAAALIGRLKMAPSVSDTSPDGLCPQGLGADTSPANAGEEIPPPVTQEAPMPFEAPTPGHAAREILRREWAAGTPAPTIVGDILRAVPDAPAWAHDKRRLGIEAARIGVKRPEGMALYRPGRPTMAKGDPLGSRIRKPGPPAHASTSGRMGVGQLPPPPPPVETPKPAAVARAEQSVLTKQYGPYVEKLVGRGMSYDDIKRRMNKELPRDFTREDVKLIAEELGL